LSLFWHSPKQFHFNLYLTYVFKRLFYLYLISFVLVWPMTFTVNKQYFFLFLTVCFSMTYDLYCKQTIFVFFLTALDFNMITWTLFLHLSCNICNLWPLSYDICLPFWVLFTYPFILITVQTNYVIFMRCDHYLLWLMIHVGQKC